MDTGKVIVITGASDGIGAAAARSLAKAGHQVMVVGRSPEKTNRIAAELGPTGTSPTSRTSARSGNWRPPCRRSTHGSTSSRTTREGFPPPSPDAWDDARWYC